MSPKLQAANTPLVPKFGRGVQDPNDPLRPLYDEPKSAELVNDLSHPLMPNGLRGHTALDLVEADGSIGFTEDTLDFMHGC